MKHAVNGLNAMLVTFVHVATVSTSSTSHSLSLMTQNTEAYNNSSSISMNKLPFIFGLTLTLQDAEIT